MRRGVAVCLIVVGMFVLAGVASAQDTPKPAEGAKTEGPIHYYHLQFAVQELNAEGKVTNSRTYSMTVDTGKFDSASIRSGSRVPIVTGSFQSGEKSGVNTQYQYIDLGANIDANNAQEVDHKLSVNITADITSMAAARDPELHQPVIRQNRWKSVALVPVGKPTTIFTSDSLDSTGSMQVVVTPTLIQ